MIPSSLGEFFELLGMLESRDNVQRLGYDELEERARPFGRATSNGGAAYYSNVRNRSAAQSVVFGSERVQQRNLSPLQQGILDNADQTLDRVREYLKIAPLVCVKRTIGDNGSFEPKCTLYLSTQRQDNIRQAYLWSRTLREYAAGTPGPELTLVCIPEWPEQGRQVLVFPEEGLTVVLGSDYVGEVKMGFLRMAMWKAKHEGMLALHAGSKLVTARGKDGHLRRYGMLLFGLSGTGKTTHSCHDHGLTDDGEGIEILQDDIVFLRKDGSALGTERGFYLKTEGIGPEHQPIIYKGLEGPDALYENVVVESNGETDFANMTLGTNGRAVLPRTAFAPYAGDSINLPPASELDGLVLAFITRRMTVLPIAAKMDTKRAAASFMLGESIETSAGDPRRAGQTVRVVGTNPFIIGDPEEEGNWFHDFLEENAAKVQTYVLNTGGVGELSHREDGGRLVMERKCLRVEIPEMAAIIRGILRGTLEWQPEPFFGSDVPATVDGVDMTKFALNRFYDREQERAYVDGLKIERREWMDRFPGLRPGVAEAVG